MTLKMNNQDSIDDLMILKQKSNQMKLFTKALGIYREL